MGVRSHRFARVHHLLWFLIAVDAALSLAGFGWPELWFSTIHGAAPVDPQRFLPRTAAAWLAFLALQVIALARFRVDPAWLAVVAGARLGDALTDWTHALLAPDLTWIGGVLLFTASPVNLLAGAWLLGVHRELSGQATAAWNV